MEQSVVEKNNLDEYKSVPQKTSSLSLRVEKLSTEDRGQTLQKIDQLVLQQEPGYPIEKYSYKAPYARGLVIEKIMGKAEQTEVIVGYEGLDIEVWVIHKNALELIAIKKTGYKRINSDIGHEGANYIRNDMIRIVNSTVPKIIDYDEDTFADDMKFASKFIEDVGPSIEKSESKAYENAKIGKSSDHIPGVRIITSGKIPFNGSESFEQAKEKVNLARQQMEMASKFIQMQSAVDANTPWEVRKVLTMRSMADILYNKPEVIETIGDMFKGFNTGDYFSQTENGQVQAFNPQMKNDLILLQSFIEKDLFLPELAETLTEFYTRRIADIPWQERLKKQILTVDDQEKYRTLVKDLIQSELTESETGYFTNDVVVQHIIGQALAQNDHLWILHADREGMLFLNARLGVDKVDKGLKKQAVFASDCVKEIVKEVHGAVGAYCLRNVDENIIVISVPRKTDLDITNVGEIIERDMKRMYEKMAKISELTVESEKDKVVSHASGVLIKVDTNKYLTPGEVVREADKISDKYKTYRNRRQEISPFISMAKAKEVIEIPENQNNYNEFEKIVAIHAYLDKNYPIIESGLIQFLI